MRLSVLFFFVAISAFAQGEAVVCQNGLQMDFYAGQPGLAIVNEISLMPIVKISESTAVTGSVNIDLYHFETNQPVGDSSLMNLTCVIPSLLKLRR